MVEHIFIRHVSTDKNTAEYKDSENLQEKIQSLDEVAIAPNRRGLLEGFGLKWSLADHLSDHGVTGVFTVFHSGYKRTEETLAYVLESLRMLPDKFTVESVRQDDRIQDVFQGQANNVPYDKAREMFPGYARDIDTLGYLDAVPPGGESHRNAIGRYKEYLEDIKKIPHHTITITHFSSLTLIRKILENLTDEEVLHILSTAHPPNASITRYSYDERTNTWDLLELHERPWLD